MKTFLFVLLLIAAFFAGSHFMGNDKPSEPVKTEAQIQQEKAQEEKLKQDKKNQAFNEELKNPKLVGQLPDGRSVKQYVHTINGCSYNCENIIYVVDGSTTATVNRIVSSGKTSYVDTSAIAVDEMSFPSDKSDAVKKYNEEVQKYNEEAEKLSQKQKSLLEMAKTLK